MKQLTTLLKLLLVAVGLTMGTSAWAQITWTFIGNTAVWAQDGVTLSGGNQYDENASAVGSGGVTFTGTNGFVSTAKGIGFCAVGSTTDENISIVVPKGYKASVSVYTSSNRTVVAHFGDAADQTFNAGWATSTKEFNNAEGTDDVVLYLYCNQNPGGDAQNKAPFLESITLVDMGSVSSYPWTANAIATISGNKTILKSYNSAADVDEGSEYTINVEKVIKYDEDYYVLNDAVFDVDVYSKTFIMGDEAPVHEFTYEKLEDCVFYGEVEDIFSEGARANKSVNVSVLSNGGGYYAMGTEGYVTFTFTVPESGVYNLALGMNNTNSRERGFNYAIDGAEVSGTIEVKAYTPFVQNIVEKLEAGEHTITMNITYSLTPVFDYLLITKLPSAVTATVSDAGWATLYTPYALDFSGVTGLTAYTATLSESTVTLTAVKDVPTNTGVVLKGAEGKYDVPVIASSETAKGDLQGSAEATAWDAFAGNTLYILTMNGENAQFNPVVSGEIEAGKAFLKVADDSEVQAFTVVFADETTGIHSIDNGQLTIDNAVFDLSGRRVAKAQKGVYIVNGKKVVK